MLVEFNLLLVLPGFISVIFVFGVPSQLNEYSDSTTPCRSKRLLCFQDWPALGHIQLSIHWELSALSLGVQWPSRKRTTHVYLVPTLRTCGAIQ